MSTGSPKSPWKENKVNIMDILKTHPSNRRKPAFPNKQFNTQGEMFEFMVANQTSSVPNAYALKKEQDKQIIPMPIIKSIRKEEIT